MRLEDFKQKLAAQGVVEWSSPPPLEFFWRFEVQARPEDIWPYLSDTSRFNRELGFGTRTQVEHEGRMLITTKMLGLTQQWIEEPWNWLSGETIASHRTYLQGMGKSVHSVFHIAPDSATGKLGIHVYFGWTPAHFFWRWLLQATASVIQNKFAQAFAKIEQHVSRQRAGHAFEKPAVALPEDSQIKLQNIRSELHGRKLDPACVDNLCEHVATADDLEVESIRVMPLAKKWNVETRDLLVTCLHAARLGLLKLSWDVICPHCRGSRLAADGLAGIPAMASCEVCDIDFSTADDNSIEVLFHIQDSIRPVAAQMYCAAEPFKKRHIKIQRSTRPGRSVEITAPYREGLYRARLRGEKQEFRFEVQAGHSQRFLNLGEEPPADIRVGSPLTLRVHSNKSSQLVVEELYWENAALKPAQIFSLPEFRELFPGQALNADVKLYLGEQNILFTDIVGSTKFYSDVGDGKAFAEVRSHFREVFEEVRTHHGVVVKTIGDAVMASFTASNDALKAAIAIQKRFLHDRPDTSIRLRISIHGGPVIAVHLNTAIDYFGNTVNVAAKIQALAGASEIALTESLFKAVKVPEAYLIDKRVNRRESTPDMPVYIFKVA